ncbi:MAG: hypothetical protein V4546_17135 [Bacteroidota bacterium]
MIFKHLSFAISITFISWIVGMLVNAFLRKTKFYDKNLTHLNFIKNERLNKFIGLGLFKWIVKNTFFRFFNQKIKINKRIEKVDLVKLRKEMTISEIDHLVAFIFVNCFSLFSFYNFKFIAGTMMMLVNVLMNLYPSLLQQENKRRIDQFLNKF